MFYVITNMPFETPESKLRTICTKQLGVDNAFYPTPRDYTICILQLLSFSSFSIMTALPLADPLGFCIAANRYSSLDLNHANEIGFLPFDDMK